MSMSFFVLHKTGQADYDLTPFLDVQNYNINAADVLQEWTDANYVIHRAVVRQRRSGTITVGFSRAADYGAFMAALSTYLTGGAYSVTAYVNNAGGSVTFSAYIDTTGAGKWDLTNGRQWQTVELIVEEL